MKNFIVFGRFVENASKSAREANSKVYLYLKQCRDIIDLCLN